MKILVLNPGSESLKAAVFQKQKKVEELEIRSSKYSFKDIVKSLTPEISRGLTAIDAIGIRIVHGGQYFSQPTTIGKREILKLKKLAELAPLHNKVSLKLIEDIKRHSYKIKIIGVFDTAFHQTIPEYAATYAIPRELSKKFGIKKYGFHGIACQNILRQLKEKTGKIPKKLIICHLGGGASITAVKNGKSVDTSMGFTPLEGLMMATRAGDLDDGVLTYLAHALKISADKVLDILNQKSGIYGITKENNFEKVIEKAKAGDRWCKLATEMFTYRITQKIFAYYGVLGGVDLLTFSGGIGEGSSFMRNLICDTLKVLGDLNVAVFKVDESDEIAREVIRG